MSKGVIRSVSLCFIFIGNYNVISVDWRRLANTAPFYNIAAGNTKPVGYITADLIKYILKYYGNAKIENFHPVGFSLGAHVAGHLGYHLDGSLSRITGLDPAGIMLFTLIFMIFIYPRA